MIKEKGQQKIIKIMEIKLTTVRHLASLRKWIPNNLEIIWKKGVLEIKIHFSNSLKHSKKNLNIGRARDKQ